MGSLDEPFVRIPGFNDLVEVVVVHPDGGIIVGGEFTSYQGIARQYITKLNADGSLDTTFDSSTGFDGPVISLAIHPDGGIIVGGFFTTYKGTPRQRIAKLNGKTAALDATFDSASGFDNFVTTLAIHRDGGVIAGGIFTTYKGTSRQRIAKLNDNTAALDMAFDSSSGFNIFVTTLAIYPDGGVIVGGIFSTYNGIPRQNIAKLNDKTAVLDTTFDTSTGFNTIVFSLAIQSNRKIVAGGQFSSYKGIPTAQSIARLYGFPLNPATGKSFSIRTTLKTTDLKVRNIFVIPLGDIPGQEPGSICLSAAGILVRKPDGSVGTIALI